MRMIFSLVGLIIAVAIVGILTKKQMAALTTLPDVVTPATATPANPANIGEQSKQMQTQVKDQLNEAMKAAAEAQQKALEVGNGDKPAEKTGSAY